MSSPNQRVQLAPLVSPLPTLPNQVSPEHGSFKRRGDEEAHGVTEGLDSLLRMATEACKDSPSQHPRSENGESLFESVDRPHSQSLTVPQQGNQHVAHSEMSSVAPSLLSLTQSLKKRRETVGTEAVASRYGSFFAYSEYKKKERVIEIGNPFIVDPNSLWYRLWSMCLFLFAFYNCVVIPLRVAFGQPEESNVAYLTTDILQDILFLIDMYFSFRRGFYVHEHFVTTKHRIHQRYLKGWFGCDLVAAIPFDFIQLALGRYEPALRLTKLLRISYLKRFSILKTVHLNRTPGVDLVRSVTSLILLVCQIMMLAHIVACVKYWVHSNDGIDEWSDASLYEANSESIASRYLVSLYWSISILTGIGSTEPPTTYVENGFTLSIMIFGIMMFAYVIGQVGATTKASNAIQSKYQDRLHYVNRFLELHHISDGLRIEVHRFFSYWWSVHHGYEEVGAKNDVPMILYSDMCVKVTDFIIGQASLFRGLEDGFVPELVQHVKTLVCVPDQWIIHKSARVGDRMYFIREGECSVVIGKGVSAISVAILGKGDHFGHFTVFGVSRKRGAAIRSVGYTTLFYLEEKDLKHTLKNFPKSAKKVLQRVRDEYKQMKEKNNVSSNSLLYVYEGTTKWQRIRRYILVRQLVSYFRIIKTKTDGIFSLSDRRVTTWRSLILVFILYNLIALPIRFGFFNPDTTPHTALLFFDALADIAFIFDIYLNFHTAYFHRGIEILDRDKIRSRYLSTTFALDVISAVPLDWVLLPLTGFHCLLRLNKVVKIQALIERIQTWMSHSSSTALSELITSCFSLILLAHWMGSIYYSFTRTDGFSDSTSPEQGSWLPDESFEDAPFFHRLFRSMFFSLTILTGVGKHPAPHEGSQILFTTFGMALGVLVIAFLIQNVSKVLANLDTHADAFARRAIVLRGYFDKQTSDVSINTRLRSFLVNKWSYENGINTNAVLKTLPKPLRTAVSWELCAPMMNKIYHLAALSEVVMQDIVYRFSFLHLPPGEIILRKGWHGDHMFFIHNGIVELYKDESHVESQAHQPFLIGDGSFFGEGCMYGKRRSCHARCRTPVTLLVLERKDFNKLCSAHPLFGKIMEELCATREENNLKIHSDTESIADHSNDDLYGLDISTNSHDRRPSQGLPALSEAELDYSSSSDEGEDGDEYETIYGEDEKPHEKRRHSEMVPGVKKGYGAGGGGRKTRIASVVARDLKGDSLPVDSFRSRIGGHGGPTVSSVDVRESKEEVEEDEDEEEEERDEGGETDEDASIDAILRVVPPSSPQSSISSNRGRK